MIGCLFFDGVWLAIYLGLHRLACGELTTYNWLAGGLSVAAMFCVQVATELNKQARRIDSLERAARAYDSPVPHAPDPAATRSLRRDHR